MISAFTHEVSLCFIGPMVGKNENFIPTPGDFLFDSFRGDKKYSVIAASANKNKFARLFDICRTILINHKKIDILILSVYVGQSFFVEDIASVLAYKLGIPVVMWLHNGLMPTFVSLFPGWSRRVLGRAKALVAPSPFLARALKPFGWQVHVIPNPVNLSLYPCRIRRSVSPRLLWMRSFYPYYNPQMALRVIASLVPQLPDISLVMAGKDKGMQSELLQNAESLGLSSHVYFPGFLNTSEKIHAYDQADIFINTNSVDNAPVSIIEAWAMGLPVISTEVGGIADLVTDGKTGLLVPDDDNVAMANAIQILIGNPILAEKLSTNGRVEVEKFSWPVVKSSWQCLFDQILSTKEIGAQ